MSIYYHVSSWPTTGNGQFSSVEWSHMLMAKGDITGKSQRARGSWPTAISNWTYLHSMVRWQWAVHLCLRWTVSCQCYTLPSAKLLSAKYVEFSIEKTIRSVIVGSSSNNCKVRYDWSKQRLTAIAYFLYYNFADIFWKSVYDHKNWLWKKRIGWIFETPCI